LKEREGNLFFSRKRLPFFKERKSIAKTRRGPVVDERGGLFFISREEKKSPYSSEKEMSTGGRRHSLDHLHAAERKKRRGWPSHRAREKKAILKRGKKGKGGGCCLMKRKKKKCVYPSTRRIRDLEGRGVRIIIILPKGRRGGRKVDSAGM